MCFVCFDFVNPLRYNGFVAMVVQLAERLLPKQEVTGSNPAHRSIQM